jgi:hypothetical protein
MGRLFSATRKTFGAAQRWRRPYFVLRDIANFVFILPSALMNVKPKLGHNRLPTSPLSANLPSSRNYT